MGWFSERYEREEAPEASAVPARRRRMLLLSMVLVIPLGVLSVGTGINVGIAFAVGQSYAAGDYQGAAAWARAGVSLNPFDRYLPQYNLGTAYAAGDLLPEAVPELQASLDNAPSPEAACYPRGNLALTYVRLGNRYFEARQWQDAIDAYRAAQALWAEQPDDVCRQDQSFDETAEESEQEAQQGEQEAEEQQANEPQPTPTPGESGGPDPQPSPTPGQSGEPQPSPTPGESGEPQPSPTPGETGEPQPSPTPGESGEPQPSPTPGESGEPQPSPTPGETGEPQPSPTPGESGDPQPQPTPGEGEQPTSDALGEKLEQLIAQNEAADRERENGGPKQGLAKKPW